ncbi:DUF4260 domain-containing protein [Methylobacterium iners]|uniref:DUF4260 domain-containing protein n=1 Tax=Methylobacterium iners TaxID=418707 RepID=A0ABQ4RUM3_9HYPH|nr:DUF4260 domain-containing protein [Methylobacterium iners]GJD93868.1 hypothetical protein OCOJLMKI_1066 [Methylobacterium iners]
MTDGAVGRMPGLLLRIEGAAALAGAVFAYGQLGSSWWLFAGLLLLPDISMLGYLINLRIGATSYNLAHTYAAPALLAAAGVAIPALLPLAAIWAAHIGMDRTVGYGLKYPDAFKHTHLSRF